MNEPKKDPFTSHLINSKILERHAWLWTTSCMFGQQLACKGNEIYFLFVDVDWGCDLDSRCSTLGILHKLKDYVMH